MHPVRTVIGTTTIDPKLLTGAERLQYENVWLRVQLGNHFSRAISLTYPRTATGPPLAMPEPCLVGDLLSLIIPADEPI